MSDAPRIRIDKLSLTGVPPHRRREIGATVAQAVRDVVATGGHTRPGALDAVIGKAISAALTPKPGGRT